MRRGLRVPEWSSILVCLVGCGRLGFDAPGHATTHAGNSDAMVDTDASVVTTDAPPSSAKTFGKSSIGTNSGDFSVTTSRLSRFTIQEAGLATGLQMYIDTSAQAGGAVRGLIYGAKLDGEPDTLVAVSLDLPVAPQPAAWVAVAFDPPVSLAANDYWIGTAASLAYSYRFDAVPGALRYGDDSFQDGAAPVFTPTNMPVDDRELSVFVEYLAE